MSKRVLSSILVVSAVLLVPFAVFFKSDALDTSDVLIEQELNDDNDVSLSLLQKSSSVHVSASTAKNSPIDKALAVKGVDMQAALAEYLAMTIFVIIGCGSAMGIANKEGYAWVLQVALTFGIAITVLAYNIGHISGGQINCAVTFALALNGSLSWLQALVNVIFQLLGSVTGAFILCVIYPKEKDLTGALGSNGVSEGYSKMGAFVGEVVGTFLLCFTVLETAVNPATLANRPMDCLAIGLSVFLAHSVLIPIDGCSINPTRSFGPAFVAAAYRNSGKADAWSTFSDMHVFWLGPLTGAAVAAGIYAAFS